MPTAPERTPERYIDRATAAFRNEFESQVSRFGVPASDPEEIGRRAATMSAVGLAWDDDVGPFYDTAGACAALGGISKQAVSQRVKAHTILALRLAQHGPARWVYPVWQFDPAVRAHIPRILAAAGYDHARPVTGWTIAAWLTTPDAGLEGQRPLDALRDGRDGPVLDVAPDVAGSLGVTERAAVAASPG